MNTACVNISLVVVGMIVAAGLLVIFNLTRIIWAVVGNHRNQDCNYNNSPTINNTWTCEQSSHHLTILAFDVTSFISNMVVSITKMDYVIITRRTFNWLYFYMVRRLRKLFLIYANGIVL